MLSVGEQQRVAVARALANKPKLLLADEPTANVDAGHQQQVLDLLRETCREENVALVLVTHSPEVARQFDRVEELEEFNQVRESGGSEGMNKAEGGGRKEEGRDCRGSSSIGLVLPPSALRLWSTIVLTTPINPTILRSHESLEIAWRSIQQRALASALTALSMALGVSLVVAVLVIYSVVYQSFHRGGEGYDLVVGGNKGSRLDLVLSAVYYMGQPIEPMPYEYYQKIVHGDVAAARWPPFPSALATATRTAASWAPRPICSLRDHIAGRAALPVRRGPQLQDREFHGGGLGATAARRCRPESGRHLPPQPRRGRPKGTNTSPSRS